MTQTTPDPSLFPADPSDAPGGAVNGSVAGSVAAHPQKRGWRPHRGGARLQPSRAPEVPRQQERHLVKRCRLCGVDKSLSEFYLRHGKPDTRCKRCVAAYNKTRFDAMNEARRARRRSLKKSGLCVACGKNPVSRPHSGSFCSGCLAYRRENSRKYRSKVRDALFDLYGGRVCNCCGETEDRFLSFDHIHEDGAHQRRLIGSEGASNATLASLYRHLRDAGFPPILQVLCHNCNMGKHLNGGVCPHEERD